MQSLATRTSADSTETVLVGRTRWNGPLPAPSLRRWASAAVIAAAALTACGIPEPASVASGETVSTGYRGGIRTAVALEISPGVRLEDWRWKVGDHAAHPIEGTTKLSVQLLELNCDSFPGSLPCPTPEQTLVVYRFSALLDMRDRLELVHGDVLSEGPRLVFSHKEGMEAEMTLQLPSLEPGEHCVLIGAFEDDATVVEGQFPDHSNAALFMVDVGESAEPRCDVPALNGTWWAVSPDGPIQECGLPFLTEEPRLYAPDLTAVGGLWAVLPTCGQQVNDPLVVFAVDGVLQGSSDALSPMSVPQLKDSSIVIPVDDPGKALRVMVVDRPTIGPTTVRHSRPQASSPED